MYACTFTHIYAHKGYIFYDQLCPTSFLMSGQNMTEILSSEVYDKKCTGCTLFNITLERAIKYGRTIHNKVSESIQVLVCTDNLAQQDMLDSGQSSAVGIGHFCHENRYKNK